MMIDEQLVKQKRKKIHPLMIDECRGEHFDTRVFAKVTYTLYIRGRKGSLKYILRFLLKICIKIPKPETV